MRRASTRFDEEERRRINDAIIEAESRTSAEILCVVATDSGRYDRAEDMVGLLGGVLAMAAAWVLFQRVDPAGRGWGEMPLALGLPTLLACLVGGFVAGTLLAMNCGPLRRLFTPRAQMRDGVMARARQAFFDQRVHHTADATGLLVYVSLHERLATILADQKALDAMEPSALDGLCAQLAAGLRQGDAAGALCEVIRGAAERLATVLPRDKADVNELPDALVTID